MLIPGFRTIGWSQTVPVIKRSPRHFLPLSETVTTKLPTLCDHRDRSFSVAISPPPLSPKKKKKAE
jgi:hypothetical protein